MSTLQDALRQLDRTKHLRSSLTIGRVVDNQDEERRGRVQMEFPHDWQGSPTAAWAMPIYPLTGDIGMDPPEEGEYLVCLFLDGNPMEPYYLGRSIGMPRKTEAENVSYPGGDALGVAVAEAVSGMMQDMLRWMGRHTHDVLVTANGTSSPTGGPIAPIPTKNTTMPSRTQLPKLKELAAKRVRLHKRNDPDAQDTPGTAVQEPSIFNF